MHWTWVTAGLCTFGFLKEFRPLEPFLTPYLLSETKNFTDLQLYSQVYPFWTYSYLVVLVPLFLMSDLLRYKPVMVFGALTYISTYILLLAGRTTGEMQLMQFFYGCAAASEIAYFAYIYRAVDGKHYQKATSYTNGALECGRLLAFVVGQALLSSKTVQYGFLLYLSIGTAVFSLVIPFMLPTVPWPSIVSGHHDDHDHHHSFSKDPAKVDPKNGPPVRQYFVNLFVNFKKVYSVEFVWRWSLWWALATCGLLQVCNYVQNLWDTIRTDESDIWNGMVEAIVTCLGQDDGKQLRLLQCGLLELRDLKQLT